MLKKRDAAASGGGSGGVPGACQLMKLYPLLWEFLTAAVYPDKQARVQGTLTLFADQGAFKACLNDRDNQLSAFVSGPSLTALLVALEAGLKDDDLEWRQPQKAFKKKS